MPISSCPFCHNANPSAAKFCNECGAQLTLKPCAKCDAINDAHTARCHQCGATFEAALATCPADGVESIAEYDECGAPALDRAAVEGVDRTRRSTQVEKATGVPDGVGSAPHAQVTAEAAVLLAERIEPTPHIPESVAQSFESARVNVRDNTDANGRGVDGSGIDAAEDNLSLHLDVRAAHRSLRNQGTRISRRSAFFAGIAVVAMAGTYFAYVPSGPLSVTNEQHGASVSTPTSERSAAMSTQPVEQRGAAMSTQPAAASDPGKSAAIAEPHLPASGSLQSSEEASEISAGVATVRPKSEPEPGGSVSNTNAQQPAANTHPTAEGRVATSRPQGARARHAAGSRPKQTTGRVRPSARSEPVLPSPSGLASTSRQNDADAIATERLIAQDLVRFSGRPGTNASQASEPGSRDVQRDRDAIVP